MSSRENRKAKGGAFGGDWPGHLRQRAENASVRTTHAGAEAYSRVRHLPRLIGVEADKEPIESLEHQTRLVARLASALRAERTRGRAGHWTYDLNRHFALKQAYAAERKTLWRLSHGIGTKKSAAGNGDGL